MLCSSYFPLKWCKHFLSLASWRRAFQTRVFWTDRKLPHRSRHFLARVMATFNLWGHDKKPVPVVRAFEIMIMSLSCPWNESIVLTSILNAASGDFLQKKNEISSKHRAGSGVTYLNLKAISSLCWAYGVIIPKEFFAGSTYFVMAFNSSMTKVASSVFRKFGVRSFASGELCVKSKLRIPYAFIGKAVSMHSGEHFNRLL